MAWQEPKIDWNSEDYYNYGDLDRVEGNSAYLADLLTTYRGQPVTIDTFIDRDIKRIDFYDSLNRIEGNIQTLADNFYTPVGWDVPKTDWQSGKGFKYSDANRLEKNLFLLYELVTKTIDSMKYCGTFKCGEEGI